MIDKSAVAKVVTEAIEGTELFLVEVTVSHDNCVEVLLDSMTDVTIDNCVSVNDVVLAAFDRDVEDFELTVGSYGISAPFKVRRQYEKNLGGEVEVLTADGRKLKGTLKAAGDDTVTLGVVTKVKPEGKKRPELVEVDVQLNYSEIKYTKNIIQF